MRSGNRAEKLGELVPGESFVRTVQVAIEVGACYCVERNGLGLGNQLVGQQRLKGLDYTNDVVHFITFRLGLKVGSDTRKHIFDALLECVEAFDV